MFGLVLFFAVDEDCAISRVFLLLLEAIIRPQVFCTFTLIPVAADVGDEAACPCPSLCSYSSLALSLFIMRDLNSVDVDGDDDDVVSIVWPC